MIESKNCSHCKRLIPLTQFRLQKRTGYRQSWCWDCEKEQKRPQLLAFRNSPEGKKARNQARIRYAKSQKGKERKRELQKAWRKTAKGKAANRRARARHYQGNLSPCTLTASEWENIVRVHGYRCYWCHQKVKSPTQDHVIPLSRGGHHVKENIVPACRPCNSRKHNHLWSLV